MPRMQFAVLFIVALIVSSIGFKKFVWFISLGYGFSMAAIGIALLIMFAGRADIASLLICAFVCIYGFRLGGYLAHRERKNAAYNKVMATQVNDGSSLSRPVQVIIWLACALLYVCEASPVLFRLSNGVGTDAFGIVGAIIMACGIILESSADLQKSHQKKLRPGRFCDKGLYRIVRCPNYLGEMLTWTGMLISGLGAFQTPIEWVAGLAGWVCIIYIMFGGARRLEIRQNKNYGADPEYQRYVKTTPIILPFVHLYSVEKYTWLKG